MSKKNIVPICSAADREKAGRLLALLRERGLARPGGPGEEKTPQKGDIVLLLLSQSFAADEEAQARFFAADTAGASVIPVDLDGSAQPELVRTAVIAKNAIGAQGRSDGEIAERIASAPDFQETPPPPWLPRVLIALAALLVLGAAAWLWLGRGRGETEEPSVPAMSQSELAAAQKLGLTAEDLARITSFAIIGDRIEMSQTRMTTDSDIARSGRGFYLGNVAYDSWDWESNTNRWYSAEDGHEFAMTRYDDLSVIELMPNLRSLTLILVDCDRLPALGGLEKLESMTLSNCSLPDFAWVEGAQMLQLRCAYCGVEDLTPVASCARLRDLDVELSGQRSFILAGKCAEPLHNVSIQGDDALREIDLSGLKTATLWELRLNDLPLSDLSFLNDQSGLSQLELGNLPQLRDVRQLGSLSSLTWLWLRDLRNVNDLAAVGRCPRLKDFNMQGMRQIRDLKFLNNCKSLQSVNLGDVDIEDLSFLEVMSGNFGIGLSVFGQVRDWSALSLCSFYGSLEISPDDRRVADILPYLEGCSVGELTIGNASDLDLAMLPKVSSRLRLWNCSNVTDFSALTNVHTFAQLDLQDMPRLSSLEGLQRIRNFGRNGDSFNCEIWIDNCPRLADWSAINGCRFSKIELKKVFTLPDFGKLDFFQRTVVRLENIPGVTDMSFLDGVKNPEKTYFNFELLGLDDLRDLSALRRFRGEKLVVTPGLEPYAQALVDSKNFQTVEIDFPSGGWNTDYSGLTLLSLDELETMPPALLKYVSTLCLVGDEVVDLNQYHTEYRWDGRREKALLVDNNTGEETEMKMGSMKDLSILAPLTGLRDLRIVAQPIESLDGIQEFTELEHLRVENCQKLKDVSAAFTLQGLIELGITYSALPSVQGVQNLTELKTLELHSTDIKDISPIAELDSSSAMDWGGFMLSLGGTGCSDYSCLANIPVYRRLDLNGVRCEQWLDALSSCEVYTLTIHGCQMDQAQFERLAAEHGELKELQIPYNEKITDLTPLLGMENLQSVLISRDMKKAVAGIEGQNLPFELEIW